METVFQIIALIAVIIGTAFSFLGVLGMIRLPDVYARLHATGKVGVFGVVLLLVATAVYIPQGWGRAILLIALLMLTGPIAAHAMISAAYRIRLPIENEYINELTAIEEADA
jgi:multicomponent Na+:H+ antiporter subunit G